MNDQAHASGLSDAGTQPPYLYAPYVSTRLRAPTQPLLSLTSAGDMPAGPLFGPRAVHPQDSDLTNRFAAPPIGERLIVCGTVCDEGGRPLPDRKSVV